MNGKEGDDNLVGSPGIDRINGGLGSDVMTGGSGKDVFTCGDGIDKIIDSDPAVDVKSLNCEDLLLFFVSE